MNRYSEVAAFILAGGASSRMGRDKGLIEIAGLPLVVRTARLVEPLVSKVTIVGAPERYGALGLPVLADQNVELENIEENKVMARSHGPLTGISSALGASSSPWNLILACDLPYLNRNWLDWLLTRATRSQAQIIMPRTHNGLEPLAAVYRRECTSTVAAARARGVRKVTDALAGLRIQILEANEWREVDPEGRVLTNMNTPADYDEARARFETDPDQSTDTINGPK